MINLNRAGRVVGWLLVFILMGAYCQHFFAYNYFYVEQFNLFRFNCDYAWQTLSQPGGGVAYLAAFLTQFFFYPYAGALLSALLFTAISWQMAQIWKKLASGFSAPVFYFLPAVTLLWAQTNFIYHWEGTLALWISLLVLNLCLAVRRVRIQWLFAGIWAVAGFYWVGPYSLLTVIGIILIRIFSGQTSRKWMVLFLLPLALITPFTLYYRDVVMEWRFLLTSDAYYELRVSPPVMIRFAGWACLLNLVAACLLGQRTFSFGKWGRILLPAVQVVFVAWLMHVGSLHYNSSRNYGAKILDYYCRTGQWQQILDFPGLRADQNMMHACYQNLALLHLDQLGDRLIDYKQCGAQGLVIPWNMAVNTSMLLSDLYYQIGDIALAQEMAFEGMIASERAVSPRLLLRLIQTNLIYGYDAVAEKYIRILEETLAYADEARLYRQFIGHPEKVRSDPELGGRYACVEHLSGLTNESQLFSDLGQIMHSNTSWRPAFQYFGAMCLLSKNDDAIRDLVEHIKEMPDMRPVPRLFQEAVILVHEDKEELWADYGVTPEVANRFKAYRRAVISARRTGQMYELNNSYGNTYWYYYMFKR